MKSIRELIEERRLEVSQENLLPHRAAEILKELSALLGNVLAEIRKADLEYNRILLGAYNSEEKANRAKIKAETSPEYERMREAKDTKIVVLELIHSLKYYLRSFEDEKRASYNQ